MFKIKFGDVHFISNKKKVCNTKIILFFYGLGCSSDNFKFLLNSTNCKSQFFIAELPGHNYLKYNRDNLYSYSRKIYLFLKKNKIKEIIFFAHSLGGIIPILLVKNFLKKKILVKKFINYEGNLTKSDTETLTKKTASYKKYIFINNKFNSLVSKCTSSREKFLNHWAKSLKKTSSSTFYDFSNQCVKLSQSNELLNFFKTFFRIKVYIYGENSQIKVPEYTYGSIRYKIKNSGHFSFFESKLEFSRIFEKLLLKKI